MGFLSFSIRLIRFPFENQICRSGAATYSIAMLNAETVLHDHWGGAEYWMARRSMRFNSNLKEVANAFRSEDLNSTDTLDGIKRSSDWRDDTVK